MRKKLAIDIDKTVYAIESLGAGEAEIRMYGEIVTTRPTDWWTGEPIPGEFIVKDEFVEDLKQLTGMKKVSLHMDSIGGEVLPALTIHNLIRDMVAAGTEFDCYIDGVAMSAATIIMCACTRVIVSSVSLLMIHKCGAFLCDYYNADELRKEADSFDAYDEAIINAYVRKTGLSKTTLSHMMSETFYMTGNEAVEKSFADVLKEEEGDPFGLLTASENGLILFSNGHALRADGNTPLPEQIKRIPAAAFGNRTADPTGSNKSPDPSGTKSHEKEKNAMTIEDLRRDAPELVAQLEADARAAGAAEASATATDALNAAVSAAVEAERARIRDIDGIASLFDPALVAEAKYGENPCMAQELSYRAAQEAAKKGRDFIAAAIDDANASGAAAVASAPEPAKHKANTEEERMNEARLKVSALLKNNDKKGE